jgi:hypothetical protein
MEGLKPPVARFSMLLLIVSLAGCRPQAQQSQPPIPVPVVRAYTQFSPGDTLELVRIQLNLAQVPVRYRTGMPDGVMGMVYFMDDGNLHVDAKKVGDTWVLTTTPLLDPSTLTAAERLAAWDNGSDPQNRNGAGQK